MVVTPRSGGPTTQAGIFFQNCLTSLRLAHMLTQEEFATSDGTPLGRIVRVRVEAPTPVDDTVVEFSSGRTEYIQAKMDIKSGGEVWVKLWEHFYDQYHSPTFKQGRGGDAITLAVRWSERMSILENLLARADESDTATAWHQQLTQEQKQLRDKIVAALREVGHELDEEALLRFARSVNVWQSNFEGDPRESDTFEAVISRTLRGTVTPVKSAFSVLIALVAMQARQKGSWDYEALKTQLKASGVEISAEPRKESTAGRKRADRERRLDHHSIEILNNTKVSHAKIRDIVGEVIEGVDTNSGHPSSRKIRILNEAVLRDVEVRDIIGRKLGKTSAKKN